MVNYKNNIPSAVEFNYLTNSVGWGTRENEIVLDIIWFCHDKHFVF